MVACCVCGKKSSDEYCRKNGISYHSLPLNDEQRMKIWLRQINREGFKPTKYSRICCEHFYEEDFEYQLFTNKRLLKATAIPTKFCFDQASIKFRQKKYEDKISNKLKDIKAKIYEETHSDVVQDLKEWRSSLELKKYNETQSDELKNIKEWPSSLEQKKHYGETRSDEVQDIKEWRSSLDYCMSLMSS